MTEETELFNTERIDDLPPEMQQQVGKGRLDTFERQIIDLFEIAGRPLSIDEVMVALYRKYKVEKKRRQVLNKLYQMSSSKSGATIETIQGKKGIYQLNRKENITTQENSIQVQ